MWRSGGRGALRTWHNQFCLNCFNEEIICDLLDLVGPRRGLRGLTWWVLRYFCSHCKSVINMLPNEKMQKDMSQSVPYKIRIRMLSLMWSMNRSKYIWWLTFPSIFHYAMLSICPCLACHASCDRCQPRLTWLTGQGPVTGSSELSDRDSGRLADEVICLTAITDRLNKSYHHNPMFSWVDNYGGADQQNEGASILRPLPLTATGQGIAKLGTRRIIR